MIWLSIAALSLLALAPAVWALFRRQHVLHDERTAALTLHEAQLGEVERDLTIGLIAPEEHAVARLEIQRRILAADMAPTGGSTASSTRLAWLGLTLTPIAATLLYLTNGYPTLPAQPLAPRLAAQQAQADREDAIVAQLRQALATLPDTDPNRRQGYLLLGQAEAARDHYEEAAQAWGHALALGFEPELAARTAEAMTRASHRVTPEALALFRKALDTAPKTVPWRDAAQARIAQGEHDQDNP